MRTSTILLPFALLATHVLADGASIVAAIQNISNATLALNTTVATFPDSPVLDLFAIGPLLVNSQTVLNDINEGTTIATDSANLTLTETIAVAGATTKLAAVVESTLKTLVLAKPKFDKLLIVSPVVLYNLKQQQTATNAFGVAVTAKVPTAYQGLAALLLKPIQTVFNSTIAAYEA